MIEGFEFHHLGLAVRTPRRARHFLELIGYELGAAITDPLQNVELQMASHARMPRVEIVWPTQTAGPLTTFLRQGDELVYHTCYAVPQLDEAVAGLSASGVMLREVSGPKPAVLFGGRRVAFYVVAGLGLVELLEQGASA